MMEEASLPTHTIFRPADLKPFDKKNPLPILVWGNGACANNPREHINFLNEIASHGFMVVAIGPSFSQGANRSESSQLIDALDWALAQNADKNSPYYKKLDAENVAAAGMSCGGLQTLDVAKDERLKTIMVCNSGLFTNAAGAVPGMPMPEKERLAEIHTPVLYMLGGPTDIAYENGMDDFKRIDHVPVFAANLPVGHGGTYGQPLGGEYSIVATAWLSWQLKGDDEAGTMFTGTECGLSKREGWTVDKKNIP
jgi:dienelactone hydrolase